jgi:hypothetical protein
MRLCIERSGAQQPLMRLCTEPLRCSAAAYAAYVRSGLCAEAAYVMC